MYSASGPPKGTSHPNHPGGKHEAHQYYDHTFQPAIRGAGKSSPNMGPRRKLRKPRKRPTALSRQSEPERQATPPGRGGLNPRAFGRSSVRYPRATTSAGGAVATLF